MTETRDEAESASIGAATSAVNAAPDAARPPPMIEVRDLVKSYGDTTAVRGISFRVEPGEVFGFIGPNGAGKTTTIKILSTLLSPTHGQVFVDGFCVENDTEEVRKRIGYMPDSFGVYDGLTVEEYLAFFAGAYRLDAEERRRTLADVLELTDLGGLRHRRVEALSKGMKQRLCLAKTLVHNPKLLILDEPASALDPRARIELRVLLKELSAMGKTIFISSHILTELSDLCTSVGIIEGGRLVESGDVDELRRKRWARDVVRMTFHEPRPGIREVLESFPEVSAISLDGAVVTFEYSGPPEAFYRVIGRLAERSLPILTVERERKDLETLFMALTRGELQ